MAIPLVASRSRRSWRRRCGLVGSIVLRATFAPSAALLLRLVTSLLAICFVLHCCGGTGLCQAQAPWLLLAGAGACSSSS